MSRIVRAGAMFADADLLGVPIRVIVSPKNLKNGRVEECKFSIGLKLSQILEMEFGFYIFKK